MSLFTSMNAAFNQLGLHVNIMQEDPIVKMEMPKKSLSDFIIDQNWQPLTPIPSASLSHSVSASASLSARFSFFLFVSHF